jgi:UDP-2-acetamido-2-deoxy-ribo-hexuluronate aminotransferase
MVNTNNTIDLFDLSISKDLEKKFNKSLTKILKNKDFVLGKDVSSFEEKLSNFLDVKFSYGLNSGTDSLEIALRVLKIGPGDEVIVPSFSFFATSEVVLKIGAQPIYCDINLQDLTLDTKHLNKLISEKTKAIIAVHLFGNAANINLIKKTIKKTKIHLIEDTAQAFGSKYKNKYLGTFGEFGCFSFYPTKNLGCFGDGGAIVFKKNKYSEEIKSLRNHGSTKNYYHKYIGLNSRLDSIQGLILKLKLGEINKNLNLRIKNNNLYRNLLDNNHVNLHSQINQPMNVFPITVKDASLMNKIKSNLKKNNVGFGTYYPFGLQEFPISQLKQSKSDFKNTDYVKKNIVTIPCHSKISSEDIKKISNIINES